MAFIREYVKGITRYYALVESRREGSKIRQKVLKYFGKRGDMLGYCKKHGIKPPKEYDYLLPAKVCGKLGQKLSKLNKLRPLPSAAVESLRSKFEVEMTYNSNAIEGNRLSLRETYLVLELSLIHI